MAFLLVLLIAAIAIVGPVLILKWWINKEMKKMREIRDDVFRIPVGSIREEMKEIVRRQRAHEEDLLAQDRRRTGQYVPQTEEERDFGIESLPREMIAAAHRMVVNSASQEMGDIKKIDDYHADDRFELIDIPKKQEKANE